MVVRPMSLMAKLYFFFFIKLLHHSVREEKDDKV